MKRQNLLVLAVLVSCTKTIPSKVSLPSSPISTGTSVPPVTTLPPSVPVSLKTPELLLPKYPSQSMQDAAKYFKEYANSDEFYEYVKRNVPAKLAGGNYTDRDKAIADMRKCLATRKPIPIRWATYGVWPTYSSAAIGGWDGISINQNAKKSLTSLERAGHWYHEITHVCNFTHEVNGVSRNSINSYPIILKSWPYNGGYAFEDFLIEKRRASMKLASE